MLKDIKKCFKIIETSLIFFFSQVPFFSQPVN